MRDVEAAGWHFAEFPEGRMRKTYANGDWHHLNDDGTIGDRCERPTTEERARWTAEDQAPPPRVKKMVVLGFGVPCPHCGAKLPFNTNEMCRKCNRDFGEFEVGVENKRPAAFLPMPGTKVYKVLTQRDEFFKSKFNPESLQDLLNQHAVEGWQVVSMTATDVGSFLGSFWGKGGGSQRQELIVLLEKTVE